MNPKEKMTCGVGIASPPFIVRRLTVGTESSDTVSVSNGETAAINEATERRRRIAFALLDALTKIGSELHADDVPTFALLRSGSEEGSLSIVFCPRTIRKRRVEG